jgi:multidrug efflux pump
MNFSQFFISRPIFAAVLSLLILIAGAISLFQLPISEYPEVVPPTVVVRANFPGANPKVIGETVAAPLEQAITGVENMLYMSSQSTADGKITLTITFALGTDLDNAQVQVQNRVTRGSDAHRYHRGQGVARPDHGCALDLAGQTLRHAVPVQLRPAQHQG